MMSCLQSTKLDFELGERKELGILRSPYCPLWHRKEQKDPEKSQFLEGCRFSGFYGCHGTVLQTEGKQGALTLFANDMIEMLLVVVLDACGEAEV